MTLRIDTLDFSFRPEIDATKFDESEYYLEVWRKSGNKAVDITAVECGNYPQRAWIIEAKDYRRIRGEPKDCRPSEIAHDVFKKVEDTRTGLNGAKLEAKNLEEKSHAAFVLAARTCQIVFHLEPYKGPASKFFPRDPTASVYQKLRQLFGATDAPILVLNMRNTRSAGVPWAVS